MPAADVLGPDCGAYPDAVIKTDAGAHAVADARADARTDDGDARADASSLRKSDARALVATDNSSPFVEADAVALLLITVLERHDYGCYRLW